MRLNFRNDLISVAIKYADGTIDVFDIGPECGFVREGYTYEQGSNGSDKVTSILHTFEIYWSEKKEPTERALDFRPSQTSR